MMTTMKSMRKRRIKQPLSYHSTAHLCLPQQSNFSSFVVVSLLLCSFTSHSDCASSALTNSHRITRITNNPNYPRQNQHHSSRVDNGAEHQPQIHSYHFLDQHNEYDSSSSGVSILDDDTLRLSLAIDDPTVAAAAARLSAPSLHALEPKVYLRVSGESGMIRPDYASKEYNQLNKDEDRYSPSSRPNLHSHEEDDGEHDTELEEDDEDDMNDNYHHHFPYVESYREKYVKPDLQLLNTTPPPSSVATKKDNEQEQRQRQGWSDIFAQVTTPSSLNEINSSASEHRLAEFNVRGNLPSYFYNKYSSYSEEDLENVADLDDEHSKYFVKTKPRSVTTSGSNIYSNFYYEPPSFSTKSIPIPVKTVRERFVFASARPTQDPHQLLVTDEIQAEQQQDASVMTTISYNFTNDPTMTPELSYDKEGEYYRNDNPAPKAPVSSNRHYGNNYNVGNGGSSKSPESLDESTSQSILAKITVNIPVIKSEVKTSTTPELLFANSANISPTTEATTTPTTTTTDATSIPGTPGVDYPTLGEIPQSGFDCKNQRYKGFFADIDSKCQAWHYCDFTDGHSTFLCPNGTLFSQVLLTCDWWFNVDCNQARQLYVLNERLYRYIKPPKPSFPEDFIGEHVDKWLLQQLQMGLLPKVRKKSKAKLVTVPPPTSTESTTPQN